jgi:hypothetical protein
MTKIRMVVDHPKFFYAELAESSPGWWQVRWLDSGFWRPTQARVFRAADLAAAEREAERILETSGVFIGSRNLIGRLLEHPFHPRHGHPRAERNPLRSSDEQRPVELPRYGKR